MHYRDPFRLCDLTVEYVNSVAGSQKTLTMIAVAQDRARTGTKTLISQPTLALVSESVEFARRDPDVPVVAITSREDEARGGHRRWLVRERIERHISGRDAQGDKI